MIETLHRNGAKKIVAGTKTKRQACHYDLASVPPGKYRLVGDRVLARVRGPLRPPLFREFARVPSRGTPTPRERKRPQTSLPMLGVAPLFAWIVGWGGAEPVPGRTPAALQTVSARVMAAGSRSSLWALGSRGEFAQERGYAVSVGRVTVGAGGGDIFSRPDYRVEIQRRDPPVLRKVHELADRMDGWRQESAELRRSMAPLLEKRRLSEVVPGPELSEAEGRRLAELEGLRLAEASAEELRELRALTEKRERSELRPGPPLTPGEAAALEQLHDSIDALETRVSAAEDERKTLLDTIVGYTATVDSEEKTVHFGRTPVLTVYPDDVLLIRVVDVDMSEDDVYGAHQLQVTAEMLEASAFELGPTLDRGIRALELNFRPADPGAC